MHALGADGRTLDLPASTCAASSDTFQQILCCRVKDTVMSFLLAPYSAAER